MKSTTGVVTKKEYISYGAYFMGQNIFYFLIFSYMNIYFTDVGISALAVAAIALIVKIWDAINDPIFGGIVDKVKFKKGVFLPWLKISLVGIPVATILLFSIPGGLSPMAKIIWACVAYVLWDTTYTLCDVPIYGLVTTMTDVQQERTTLNAAGRIGAALGGGALTIVIPLFREMLGGWTATVVFLSVVGAITMLPICFSAKERTKPVSNEQDVGIREMLRYVKGNKYLLVYYLAFLMRGVFNVMNAWGLYVARYCLGDEAMQSLTSVLCFVPSLLIGAAIPFLCKRMDKFRLFYISLAANVAANVIRWIAGYDNTVVYLIINMLAYIPSGMAGTLLFMFTPDCAEYGHYKSGISCPGITFSVQTFFCKFEGAVMTAFAALALSMLGFISGENAVQAADFPEKLWAASCILPTIGIVLALIILRFYKLNDHDVQLMAKCNAGEITREEAEAQMKNKY